MLTIIPPIPNKKQHRRLENNFVARRINFLEKFINACMESQDIKSSKFMLYFLSIDDENNWKNRKKKRERIARVERIKEITTLDGNVIYSYTQDICHSNCSVYEPRRSSLQKTEKIIEATDY